MRQVLLSVKTAGQTNAPSQTAARAFVVARDPAWIRTRLDGARQGAGEVNESGVMKSPAMTADDPEDDFQYVLSEARFYWSFGLRYILQIYPAIPLTGTPYSAWKSEYGFADYLQRYRPPSETWPALCSRETQLIAYLKRVCRREFGLSPVRHLGIEFCLEPGAGGQGDGRNLDGSYAEPWASYPSGYIEPDHQARLTYFAQNIDFAGLPVALTFETTLGTGAGFSRELASSSPQLAGWRAYMTHARIQGYPKHTDSPPVTWANLAAYQADYVSRLDTKLAMLDASALWVGVDVEVSETGRRVNTDGGLDALVTGQGTMDSFTGYSSARVLGGDWFAAYDASSGGEAQGVMDDDGTVRSWATGLCARVA